MTFISHVDSVEMFERRRKLNRKMQGQKVGEITREPLDLEELTASPATQTAFVRHSPFMALFVHLSPWTDFSLRQAQCMSIERTMQRRWTSCIQAWTVKQLDGCAWTEPWQTACTHFCTCEHFSHRRPSAWSARGIRACNHVPVSYLNSVLKGQTYFDTDWSATSGISKLGVYSSIVYKNHKVMLRVFCLTPEVPR